MPYVSGCECQKRHWDGVWRIRCLLETNTDEVDVKKQRWAEGDTGLHCASVRPSPTQQGELERILPLGDAPVGPKWPWVHTWFRSVIGAVWAAPRGKNDPRQSSSLQWGSELREAGQQGFPRRAHLRLCHNWSPCFVLPTIRCSFIWITSSLQVHLGEFASLPYWVFQPWK